MAIDTPAKIAVLGAGPIGLETALYARFLGYEIEVFERGDVASNVDAWRHVRMFTPFQQNSTTLALAALEAQGDYEPPNPAAMLTGGEFADGYLLPLSKTDLLDDAIRTGAEVVEIRRVERDFVPSENGDEETDESESGQPHHNFSIVTRDKHGVENTSLAAIVIDISGTYGNPCRLSANCQLAEGQSAIDEYIDFQVPDVDGEQRKDFIGKNILVVGAGEVAALAVIQLAPLCTDSPETRITWFASGSDKTGQVSEGPTQELVDRAKQLTQWSSNIELISAGEILAVSAANGKVRVEVSCHSGEETDSEFDRIVACTGYQPDDSIWRHIDADWESLADDDVMTRETNFYVLGSKRFGPRADFLLSDGHQQIRKLFSIIGDRADLDLYRSIRPLG